MKLLYISSKFHGGIGGYAATISKKLTELGFDIKHSATTHIPIKNLKNPSFALLSSLQTIFSNESFDIAHAWNLPSALPMRFAKARKRVLSVHGVYSEQMAAIHSSTTLGSLLERRESKIMQWADSLTTDSRAVQKAYQERLGVKFEYLPGPLDTSMFKDVPSVEPVKDQIAYIGRDTFEKGIDILRSMEPQLAGKVIYCTNVPWIEAMKTMKASSVYVLPSRFESMPQTIKEAFYLKVPVVATNVGSVSELVKDGVTGLLVPPNEPKKLAEAVNTLLDDRDLGEKLADAAYKLLMEEWTCEAIIPRHVEFYEKLLVQ